MPQSSVRVWRAVAVVATVLVVVLACRFSEAVSGTWREKMAQGRGERYGADRVMSVGGGSDGNASNTTAPDSHCSFEMFGGDPAAFWACRAQFSMQRNWYPDPLGGLYSYETWNGFDGFWQNGVILETFVNAAVYGNNTRYLSVIKNSFRALYDLKLAYGPLPSYDDLAWFGLSFARIYEVFGLDEFLQVSQGIFEFCYDSGWDTNQTCGGGYWFDLYNKQKQSITDLEMMQLSGRLFRLTGSKNETLRNITMRTFAYLERQQMINNETFLVADGMNMHPQNCTPILQYGPSYNMGVLIGGLIEIAHMQNDSSYIELAHRVANATIVTYTNEDGIFQEYCEPNGTTTNASSNRCTLDQRVFKGIFVRNLRFLMDISDEARRERYHNFLMGNVIAVLQRTLCEPSKEYCRIQYLNGPPFYNVTGPLFGRYWRGPFDYDAPEQHLATLELFIAAISPDTRCSGPECSYDPQEPFTPKKLTCKDKPCPPNQQCCNYKSHYTCCFTDQKCHKNGVCD